MLPKPFCCFLLGSTLLAAALPTQRALAGCGQVQFLEGAVAREISLELFFTAPPEQAQIDLAQEQMEFANRIVCDMTDGQYRISRVRATASPGSQECGDIWWFPQPGRATAGGVGNFGQSRAVTQTATGFNQLGNANQSAGHVLLYGYEPRQPGGLIQSGFSFDAGTIAHELGHAVFGLLDEYTDQRARDNVCPRGPGFDGLASVDGYFRSHFGVPFADAVINAPPPGAEQSNSIMMGGGPFCRNDAGELPSESLPLVGVTRRCLTDADCTFLGEFNNCASAADPALSVPRFYNELAVANNFDLIRGDFAVGAGEFPAAGRGATEVVVQGFLNPQEVVTCGDGMSPDISLGQQCAQEGGFADDVADCPNDPTTSAACSSCLIDPRFVCGAAPPNCGDGVVQPDEQCDTALAVDLPIAACGAPLPGVPGSELWRGGNVTCSVFCQFDVTQCSALLSAPLDLTTLQSARETSDWSRWTEVFDGLGPVAAQADFVSTSGELQALNLEQMGAGNHGLYLFAQRRFKSRLGPTTPLTDPNSFDGTLRETWQLTFAMDAGEFQGGIAGTPAVLSSWELVFTYDAVSQVSTLVSVDGAPLLANDPPTLSIGAPFTAALARSPDVNFSLEVNLNGLRLRPFESQFFQPSTVATMYARAGVSPDGQVELPQYPPCVGDTLGRLSYNSTTQRYEASEHGRFQLLRSLLGGVETSAADAIPVAEAAERLALLTMNPATLPIIENQFLFADWETLQLVMDRRFGIQTTVPLEVAPDPQADCPSPVFENFNADALAQDAEVVFVLDRSESMDARDAPGIDPTAGALELVAKRLDFVKSAAEAALQVSAGDEVRVGFVFFNENTEVVLGANAAGQLRTLVPGDVDTATEVGVETIATDFLRLSSDANGENPIPAGRTGIGPALMAAQQLFTPRDQTAAPRSVVLLTDGEANEPEPNPEAALQAALAALAADEIRVFSVPTASAAGRLVASSTAVQSGGAILDARRGTETVPVFFEVAARLQGESLALHHATPPRRLLNVLDFPSIPPVRFVSDVFVEEGADELIVLASDASNVEFIEGTPVNADYQPTLELTGPNGESVNPTAVGERYRLFRVADPAPGLWGLQDTPSSFITPQLANPTSLVTARVVNPLPKCYANASSQVTDGASPLTVSASAYFGGLLKEGVSVTGALIRPDLIEVPLSFELDTSTNTHVAQVATEDLVGQGSYTVRVRCDVEAGAQLDQGERLPSDPDAPANEAEVPAFAREVSTGFFFSTPVVAPFPGTTVPQPGQGDRSGFIDPTDPDGDGIPTEDEPEGDTDGDGRPDANDSDADNDDIPDSVDPDPTVPGVGTPTGPDCELDESATCCTSVIDCSAFQRSPLYADGSLQIADRVGVFDANGVQAPVVNAGSQMTEIGAHSITGDVHSVGPVFLRNNASVGGDVLSSSTVELQDGAFVLGSTTENAATALLSLDSFDLVFPAAGPDVRTQPDDNNSGSVTSVAPGSYGVLHIQRNSTVELGGGTYFFTHVTLEPGATLRLDLASGPTYLYARDSFTYRGSQEVVAGEPADFFVGMLGSGMVSLERAFVGTVVVPRGTLQLSTLSTSGARYRGSFFGQHLHVSPDVEVELLPFEHPWAE